MGFPFFKMSTLAVVPTQAPIQKARGLLNGKAAVQRLGISVDVFPSTCKSISSVEMPHPNILRIYIFVATVSSACKSQTDEANHGGAQIVHDDCTQQEPPRTTSKRFWR